ncbi:hypothetical protein VTO42DRAFT_2554 [Malbranchea cinnamomea]
MSSSKLPNIPSLRRQQLYLEFASLRTAPPPGVYVTVSPTDPTFWSGVLFVQKGPYASAILRFQIRFPPTYPDLPPFVTFTTDIFHPLIVPLTTYTFTTGSSDTDTVSATDEERLPPGGFSLRHGFPHWFGRSKRSNVTSASSSRNVSGKVDKPAERFVKDEGQCHPVTADLKSGESGLSTPPSTSAGTQPCISPVPVSSGTYGQHARIDVPILNLLNYIRSTFDDETVLDSIPLEAAGNPGAWHAWRSHRRTTSPETSRSGAQSSDSHKSRRNAPQARTPGEWNWEGVWAKRTQSGVQTSYLESVLFGTAGRVTGDELIRFSKLDHELLEKLKKNIIETQAASQTLR